MSSVETGQMSAVETGQMSAAETGQMSAVETRQMSSIARTDIYPVSTHNVRAKRSILDPFRTKFDVFGTDRNFSQPVLALGWALDKPHCSLDARLLV